MNITKYSLILLYNSDQNGCTGRQLQQKQPLPERFSERIFIKFHALVHTYGKFSVTTITASRIKN